MNKKQRVVEIQKQKPNRTESLTRVRSGRVKTFVCSLYIYIYIAFSLSFFFIFYAAAIP